MISLKERMILSYIVFNEAHCLSELGYDYTPCYKKINTFDKIYEYIPKIAVTTTVTDEVIKIAKIIINKYSLQLNALTGNSRYLQNTDIRKP